MNLELVDTQSLLTELMNRYDHAVFHGMLRRPVEGAPGTELRMHTVTGNIVMGMGLASSLVCICQQRLNETDESIAITDV